MGRYQVSLVLAIMVYTFLIMIGRLVCAGVIRWLSSHLAVFQDMTVFQGDFGCDHYLALSHLLLIAIILAHHSFFVTLSFMFPLRMLSWYGFLFKFFMESPVGILPTPDQFNGFQIVMGFSLMTTL